MNELEFKMNKTEEAFSIQRINDINLDGGYGYIIAGYTTSYDITHEGDMYILKIDKNGGIDLLN